MYKINLHHLTAVESAGPLNTSVDGVNQLLCVAA